MGRRSTGDKMSKLLHELLRDSSRSDRELAKVLGVSQPTISRMRKRIVEEEMIKGYTVIPDFFKMGYSILAFTFVNTTNSFAPKEKRKKWIKKVRTWMMNKPNVVFADNCRGMDVDGALISFHKSYHDFDVFITEHNNEFGSILTDVKSVLCNLGTHDIVKPFHFKYLAEDL